MTLNLTVTTSRYIYQSADYRLVDWTTGKLTDFETQKIILVNRFGWTATVCFAGVGRTQRVNVGAWLAERIDAVEFDDPFERLLEELLTADKWLSEVPAPNNRHSFSVGAFVGTEPVFALVSNYETFDGPPGATANARLSLSQRRPSEPTTYVAGQQQAVSESERRRLAALAATGPDSEVMYNAMAEVNRFVASGNASVSPACYTTYVSVTGQGGGKGHDIGDRPVPPSFTFPSIAQDAVTQLLANLYGPGGYRVGQTAIARSEPTDEYHEVQLREKPNDPNTHSNYGVFLKETKRNTEGAEREYRKALDLDPKHVNALANLAQLMWEKGDKNKAETLYRDALEIDPRNENVIYNFAQFLNDALGDRPGALTVLSKGINDNTHNSRLLLLQGVLSLLERIPTQALASFRQARDKGANQAETERGIAVALHMGAAPIGECIAAYRLAISLNPENSGLRLNLAQLLFIKSEDREAARLLREALRIGLDDSAQLEAQFYQLAHTSADPAPILQATSECLSRGARLRWDVQPNIMRVKEVQPKKATLLENVRRVMAGEQDRTVLARLLENWPSSSTR